MPKRRIRRLCVFCGSSPGKGARYMEAARHVGRRLAERGIGVVYGGGRVGLMGAVADGALAAGGDVIGVIPEKLKALEVDHQGLTELYVVESMHARKSMMAQLADGFLALPGGWGTLEEVFEVTTWAQLNYHLKPVGVLNVDGYYDHLAAFVRHAVGEGLIRPQHEGLIRFGADLDGLVDELAEVEIPELGRWIVKP
jgi:uncharacterized protein (TIGR00730 family)